MIHIRTSKRWKFKEDPDGNAVRELPMNQTFSFEDDYIGLLAIAEGAAEPTEPLTSEQERELEVVKAAIAGDEDKVAALIADGEGAAAPTSKKKK